MSLSGRYQVVISECSSERLYQKPARLELTLVRFQEFWEFFCREGRKDLRDGRWNIWTTSAI